MTATRLLKPDMKSQSDIHRVVFVSDGCLFVFGVHYTRFPLFVFVYQVCSIIIDSLKEDIYNPLMKNNIIQTRNNDF